MVWVAHLYLRLESVANSDEQIATAMVEHAARLGLPILVNFNGFDMKARPGETAEQVMDRL